MSPAGRRGNRTRLPALGGGFAAEILESRADRAPRTVEQQGCAGRTELVIFRKLHPHSLPISRAE